MNLEQISRFPKTALNPTPLLFVHGSFADARCWEEHFLPFFAQHGYAAHAFSLRGHGRSDGREELATWRLADYVDDLAQVVARLAAPPVLIGHSMGGMVVQKYLERTAAITGVVLMGSVPPQGLLPTNLHMALRHPFLFQQMALFSLLGPNYGTPEMMRRLLFSPHMPTAKLREYFSYVQAESQVVALDMMGLNPLRLKPEQLSVPIFVMGARNDVFVAPAIVTETARFYQAECCIVPDMAHAMMMEMNWRAAAEPLLAWLERTVLPKAA